MSLLLLLAGEGKESAATTSVPSARVVNEPVDDRLFVKLIHADGSTTRWGGDEPDASGIPKGISFSTSAPGGFRDASFILQRDPRRDWPDLELVDEIIIYGRTKPLGRNAFEGQTAHFPSEFGDGFNIGVKAVGNQALLSENEAFRALYVKLGFEGWEDPPLARREFIANFGFPQGKIPVSTGPDGLVWDPPKESLPTNEDAEVVCASPAGLKIAKVGYRGNRKGDWSPFESPILFGHENEAFPAEGSQEVGLTLDGAAHVASFSSAVRYAMLRARVSSTTIPAAGVQQAYDRLARYGDHGLPLREIEGTLPGLYAHDVLPHMLETGAPDLNFKVGADGTIMPNTSFAIPDLAFLEEGTVKAAIEKLNAYFLNNWAVWEAKQFFWRPWDPDRLTWKASIAGGAHWSPAGRQSETLLNGVIVTYTDVAGVSRTAGPPGSGSDYEDTSLLDPDPNNPYTRRGRRRWGVLSVGFPLAYPQTAFQVGAVYMAERRLPQRSGTLTIRPKSEGHIPEIQHPTMGPLPIWALRSEDYVELSDWPEPEPFRVIETPHYDADFKILTAQLDTSSSRLSAILERAGVRLTGIV